MKTKCLLLAFLTLSGALATVPAWAGEAAATATKAQMKRGQLIFTQICFSCHHLDGGGIPGVYPPLADSDFILNHRDQAIGVLIHGRRGPIKVNGKVYNNVMPNFNLSNGQIADALTYVSDNWSGREGAVTEKMVANQRKMLAKTSDQTQSGSPLARSGGPTQAGMMPGCMMGGRGTTDGPMMGRSTAKRVR